mmetsp:Transcript_30978/g.67038  ORF Transcript_30978/g.67038 Transcript_30978/m.67038 type:complete len:237 (+) Transcript_30978:271-981(+)
MISNRYVCGALGSLLDTATYGSLCFTPTFSPGTATTLFRNCLPFVEATSLPLSPRLRFDTVDSSSGGALKNSTSPTCGLKGPIGIVRVTKRIFPGLNAGSIDGVGTETIRTKNARIAATATKNDDTASVPTAFPAIYVDLDNHSGTSSNETLTGQSLRSRLSRRGYAGLMSAFAVCFAFVGCPSSVCILFVSCSCPSILSSQTLYSTPAYIPRLANSCLCVKLLHNGTIISPTEHV